ncbi:hypothetical protein AC626_03710 [Pseudoalteromonas rubra]|uniref:Uncharacterized protein n=1 Tax=Pseudoalteromonas rubra TaxID=43658 RepID=A0A0L0EW29_9GAMM|nr:hypothetical protein AC626_03710 [Pseudoalteromonas rubra]
MVQPAALSFEYELTSGGYTTTRGAAFVDEFATNFLLNCLFYEQSREVKHFYSFHKTDNFLT